MTAKQPVTKPAPKSVPKQWYNKRLNAFGLALVAFILGYLVSSRAFDTGSWWEYLGAFVLVIFGVNRVFNAIIPGIKND